MSKSDGTVWVERTTVLEATATVVKSEALTFAASGIVRTANGRVYEGRELFGPTSGDGFAELAVLDEDGNGWIDEGDSAFSALYVWHPFAPDRSIALKAADIGALATHAVATPWAIANTQGKSAGAFSKTSVYLKESGGVGTVSHLDLNI
jgi:hypothetical protein